MLKEVFVSLVSKYTDNSEYISLLWNKILKSHSKKNRYYHNLTHLQNVYKNLNQIKKELQDWDIILFSLFYHDYIYNILKEDNEEKSAVKAKDILQSLVIDTSRIKHCEEIILATKGHVISTNNDVNYFTDADLSILGSNWTEYQTYYKNVRKEYKYYPDFMYNKGRIKVLKHFISMPRIYKTAYFFKKFEVHAKHNLQQEINLLSN